MVDGMKRKQEDHGIVEKDERLNLETCLKRLAFSDDDSLMTGNSNSNLENEIVYNACRQF